MRSARYVRSLRRKACSTSAQGPCTATWAAAQAFDSLDQFTAIDANPVLRTLALDLATDQARLTAIGYTQNEASAGLRDAASADLVIASYVIGEMNADRQTTLAELMWSGHPRHAAGRRTRHARRLPAHHRPASAADRARRACHRTLPDHEACPLATPDWCHFVQRLPRSRAHKHLKGAELPFEDEKFSYVALARTPAPQHPARVLAQPLVTKVEMRVKLCRPDGLADIATFPRRDKVAYARVRRLGWGDSVNLTRRNSAIPDGYSVFERSEYRFA